MLYLNKSVVELHEVFKLVPVGPTEERVAFYVVRRRHVAVSVDMNLT